VFVKEKYYKFRTDSFMLLQSSNNKFSTVVIYRKETRCLKIMLLSYGDTETISCEQQKKLFVAIA